MNRSLTCIAFRKTQLAIQNHLRHFMQIKCDLRLISVIMQKILVTTSSSLKLSVVRDHIEKLNNFVGEDLVVDGFNCDLLGLPSQPIHSDNSDKGQGNVFKFAIERIRYASSNCKDFDGYDIVISIENGIEIDNSVREPWEPYCPRFPVDVCYIVLMSTKSRTISTGKSKGIVVPLKEFSVLESDFELKKFADGIIGYDKTLGELLAKSDPTIDPKNWMKSVYDIDRKTQIDQALTEVFSNWAKNKDSIGTLIKNISNYPDYPKEGVVFQDIMPILGNGQLLESLILSMSEQYRFENIDIIVGLESRGFLLGVPLALYMKKGFVPIRKAGKLPGKVIQETYEKEYGHDECEMQEFAFEKGKRVLIVDDIIATGGSMSAAINLVEKCGGVVVDCLILQQVLPLRQKCKEKVGRPYTVLFDN